eukprot:gb/GECH01014071.1/.p1 GENE.gb/GECH01014071.1/~~gb/GECH01014071.1/.p1  ORF type:complete len:280 (+),score=67.04 gb/GECH01014071.1/:1-840(+)
MSSSTESPNPKKNNLTANQTEIFNKFKDKVFQEIKFNTDRQREYCQNDSLLCRYLRARDWDITKSFKLLKDTLDWRESFKPYLLHPFDNAIQHEGETGKTFWMGKDKFGRPVGYMRPRCENTTNYREQLQLLVYTLESMIRSMDSGVEQMMWIMDFNGYSRKNAPPFSVAKETLNILSNHYPETLGNAILLDAPWLFNVFFKTISPFINPVTRSKVIFNSDKNKREFFKQFFDDMSMLPKEYGGDLDFEYDPDQYWRQEQEIWRKHYGDWIPKEDQEKN